ncbi:MAG: hypothetical protein FJ125_13055 [Deltaproteobacteria bacterium]|nr:hypothetical protein [Deltaproteobacteria bacterium]
METNGVSHTFSLVDNSSFAELDKFVAAGLARPVDEAAVEQRQFERGLHEHMRRLECAINAAYLSRLDVDVPGLVVDGQRYRRKTEKQPVHIIVLSGVVEVERTVYEPRGGHGGPTVSPLEMRIGLVDGRWSPEAASVAGSYMAEVPSREAAKLLVQSGNMTPSASTLDRLPKHVNELWEPNRVALEVAVREAKRKGLPPAEDVALILVTIDGVMTPMRGAPAEQKKTPAKQKNKTSAEQKNKAPVVDDDDEDSEGGRAYMCDLISRVPCNEALQRAIPTAAVGVGRIV